MSSSSNTNIINNNNIQQEGDEGIDTTMGGNTGEVENRDDSCRAMPTIGVNPPPPEVGLKNGEVDKGGSEGEDEDDDEDNNDDDEEEEVPLYDPRFRRLSHAECDSRRESLMHEVAERHSRRPSIQFALNENEVTEIPYETIEGAANIGQNNNNEDDDEDDDDEEESAGLSPSSESDDVVVVDELPSSTAAAAAAASKNDGTETRRRSSNHEPRRRSSLEMCSIESKAEHELREREMAHRKYMEKAAIDGEPHVDFDVKVEVETYEVPKVVAAAPSTTPTANTIINA
ncbi:hypothetical protein FOL47_006990 [Perkinsus chesapeaki]|uniref:Uncharacterized protein n=1 Tax=Perkinsus chesapeaki TaxID=330153 RepID=A0A7J6N2A1_PERCH|nr:hypothetical protein FOL47_006990 [Perkinsus chesapeaki]